MNIRSLKKTKILLISSEFPPGPGGIGHHCFSLAKALHDESLSVTVLTQGDYATNKEVESFDSQLPFYVKRYKRFLITPVTYVARLFTTYSTLKKDKFAAVFLTGKFSLWQGYLIKLLMPSVKTLSILHGSEVNLAGRWLRTFTHRAISASDYIIPVSSFTKSLLPEKIRKNHKKIVVIPNGIDNEWDNRIISDKLELKGYPRLLTVGHVSPRKGQHRVVKALPEIIKRYPEVHYHIVGLPLNRPSLEQLSKSLGVENHVTFHGRIPEHTSLSSYYYASDIFMLLSENQENGDVEGFGIVALEANQHGIPVVGAKGCGVEDAVSHKLSGCLVDGDDPAEITDALTFCLDYRESISKSAIEWANKHKWSDIVKDFIGLLS